MSVVNVDIITSFYEGEQVFLKLEFDINPKEITESMLFQKVFDLLDIEELAGLSKISSCFILDAEELPDFLPHSNGKFYFNVETNRDLETVQHTIMKLKALEKRLIDTSTS